MEPPARPRRSEARLVLTFPIEGYGRKLALPVLSDDRASTPFAHCANRTPVRALAEAIIEKNHARTLRQ